MLFVVWRTGVYVTHAPTTQKMFFIYVLIAAGFAIAQDELYLNPSVGRDSVLAELLVDAVQSVFDFVRCGRMGCPKEKNDAFIRVTDNGAVQQFASDEDATELCRVTTYRITKTTQRVLGRDGTRLEADIFGQSASGRYYLVHTLDLVYEQGSAPLDPFAAVEKEFPIGEETPCLPEIFRIKLDI